MRVIEYPAVTIRIYDTLGLVETLFADGQLLTAAPEDTDSYRATAMRLGYGFDTWALCRDHELVHTVTAIEAGLPWCEVLHGVACNQPTLGAPPDSARRERCPATPTKRRCPGAALMAGAHHRGSYVQQAAAVRQAADRDPTTRCWQCGRTKAEHGRRWTAGHINDGQTGGPLLAECEQCNTSRGATMGNKRRIGLQTTVDW